MDIAATPSTRTFGSAQSTAPQSDYLTFLNMLTVQMQNQDPLNPMNASDFAVQLATFSGVEQQTYTNQLLGALLGRTGLADLGSWVGMEARIYGGAWYDGTPVSLAPDPALGATSVTLIVRNAQGSIVDSRALDPSVQSYSWDGLRSNGQPLPNGTYTFELDSAVDGSSLGIQPVAAYVPIIEARYDGASTQVVFPGGLYADSADVTGLRRPPT